LYGKVIYADPKKYFDEETMKQLDDAAKKEFLYGEVHQDVPEEISEG
jgi:hypothetical protein